MHDDKGESNAERNWRADFLKRLHYSRYQKNNEVKKDVSKASLER
nr:hypothetical protein P5630_07395 [Bacillus subtilis]